MDYLLSIYWKTSLYYFFKVYEKKESTWPFIYKLNYLRFYHRKLFIWRFERTISSLRNKHRDRLFKKKGLVPINYLFAKVWPFFINVKFILKVKKIHLYLIKHYKGRCHALGKPVFSQRTWSNAWTAYKYNTFIRLFIRSIKNVKTKFLVKTPKAIRRIRLKNPGRAIWI